MKRTRGPEAAAWRSAAGVELQPTCLAEAGLDERPLRGRAQPIDTPGEIITLGARVTKTGVGVGRKVENDKVSAHSSRVDVIA